MNIATIYTLYGRRAGAELCFEKTIEAIYNYNKDFHWIVFCNRQAEQVLKEQYPFVQTVYIHYLDNQYKKAFWLEFLSQKKITSKICDKFWIPSGCNHFPGHWDVPVVTTFHDLGEYHIKNKYSFARTVYRKKICIPRSTKRSNEFIAVSNFTATDMEAFLKIPRKNINVVHNGSSPHSFATIAPNDSALKKWNLEKESYLFTLGRTDYIGKGLDILLEAFREIRRNNPNIKLVLAGPEGEGHKLLLENLSKDQYANSHVLYLGRVSDEELNSLYSNCLTTVISSRFEGFGFPLLEAMAHNIPVVCSDAGSLPEVAGDAALMFKSGSSKELSKAIQGLFRLNKEQIEHLKAKGQERLKMFTWEKCAQQMCDIFLIQE